MGVISSAPCDPIFCMHHANCERIWHLWQQPNPGAGTGLTRAAAVMDPWTVDRDRRRRRQRHHPRLRLPLAGEDRQTCRSSPALPLVPPGATWSSAQLDDVFFALHQRAG